MTKIGRAATRVALITCTLVAGGLLSAQRALADSAPTLVSVSDAGLGGDANSGYILNNVSVSGDGRYVAFGSEADNLVPNDSNGGTSDVFVRDLALGTTSLADVDASGGQGSQYSNEPAVSANGRYVAFISESPLVGSYYGDQVYVRDLQEGTTDLVSLGPGGQPLSQGVRGGLSISADGRYVAYNTYSPELSGSSNESVDAIAVTDRDSDGNGIFDEPGTITTTVAGYGYLGSMSPNGRYIGEEVQSNGVDQTYLIDRDPTDSGTFAQPWSTTLVSATAGGVPGNGHSGVGYVSDLGDVAFASGAGNIGGNKNSDNVLVRAGDGSGITVVGHSLIDNPQISADGRYVAFASRSPNGMTDVDDGTDEVFVTDRTTGVVTLQSTDAAGAPLDYGGASLDGLSANGNVVAFGSYSSSLLPPGSPTPVANVFERTVTEAAQGASNCFRPVIFSPAAALAVAGTPFTFTVTTCSPSIATIKVTHLPKGLRVTSNGDGTATISGTATTQDGGPYTATITAAVKGQPVANQSLAITVNNAPTFRSKPVDTVHTGTSFSYPITTEYGYPTPTITPSSLPTGVTLTDLGSGSGTLGGTPVTGDGGVYPITITATNGVGAPVIQNFVLTIFEAPVITSTPSDTITAGVEMTPFPVTATGYPAPKLVASGLPSGVKLSGGVIEGTPKATATGTYPVTITATSKGGVTTQSFTLTVTP